MIFKHNNIVNVFFTRQSEKIAMGRLLFKDRKIFFEYQNSFLQTHLELSPVKLPLKQGIFVCQDPVFEGLFGLFNDSLPDGWGRLLLDRKLLKQGLHPNELTPLDRLSYVGSHGMGALQYEPQISDDDKPLSHINLDDIADECLQVLDNDNDQYVEDLLIMNGSSAGARPKILVKIIDHHFAPSTQSNSTHEDWIIKLRSSLDPADLGPIEYAYHLMAKNAGINVPDAKLFNPKKNSGFFGVKRFDREGRNRIHMHSVSGLLHMDHRIPNFDYESLLKLTMQLTRDVRECEKQFRNAVFNVFTHNRDDHMKNFSFIMSDNGNWYVSPAYDLTFSSGPAGEHCTTVMGEGRNPGTPHLLKLAEASSLKKSTAHDIIDQVKSAISNWTKIADEAKVTKKSKNIIDTALKKIQQNNK